MHPLVVIPDVVPFLCAMRRATFQLGVCQNASLIERVVQKRIGPCAK